MSAFAPLLGTSGHQTRPDPGYPVYEYATLDRLDPESFMVAMIASFDGEEGPLANLIREFL
jgi:hypothetical protein